MWISNSLTTAPLKARDYVTCAKEKWFRQNAPLKACCNGLIQKAYVSRSSWSLPFWESRENVAPHHSDPKSVWLQRWKKKTKVVFFRQRTGIGSASLTKGPFSSRLYFTTSFPTFVLSNWGSRYVNYKAWPISASLYPLCWWDERIRGCCISSERLSVSRATILITAPYLTQGWSRG